MRPRHSTTLALALFVAAMVAWFVVRTHVSTPPNRVSERSTPDRAGSLPTRDTPSPGNDAAGTTPALPPSQAATITNGSTPAPLSSALPAVPSSPLPAVLDPATARSDAAPTNAIKVRRMVTDYHTVNGENPVGTNAEIMAAIMGKNPHQAVLGPPEGMNLNSRGELVDDWGTPYFFHQLSKDVMEIHSAGPDKIMGTADDIVVR